MQRLWRNICAKLLAEGCPVLFCSVSDSIVLELVPVLVRKHAHIRVYTRFSYIIFQQLNPFHTALAMGKSDPEKHLN